MTIAETKIYKYLESNKQTFYCEKINTVASKVAPVLSQIKAIFANYTNHDIGHSARVADYMVDLLPLPIEQYNNTELVIMLYSALFHDIGMAVSDTENDLALTKQNQIRSTHHIRSKEYLISNKIDNDYFKIDNESAVNFKETVALIVQSHGENFSWIEENLRKSECFGEDVVNPQFISCLLRISDYLDFDSRRTPDSLFNFLELFPNSKKEWEKHFPITNYSKINKNEQQIFFTGDCEDPETFRNICEYFALIDNEIKDSKSLLNNNDEKYQLLLNDTVSNLITHKSFNSIDLQYSMDYIAISQLLMGEQLYNDKRCALREIIQNSLDAVLTNQEILQNNGQSYLPVIKISISDKAVSIKDNGIGMTTSDIENYFLKLGHSFYQSNDFKNLAIKYKPISHYGIGFISSFLLSDFIIVRTSSFKQPNIINVLEIKKDNRFVIQKLESNDYPISGTEIILEKNSFYEVFPSSEEICNYIKNKFKDTGVKILLIENGIEKQIQFQKEVKNNFISLTKYLNNVECFCSDPFIVFKNKPFPKLYSIHEPIKNPGEYIFDLEYFNKSIIDQEKLKLWSDNSKLNYDINRIIQSNKNQRYLDIYPLDDDTYDTYDDVYEIIGDDVSTFEYMNSRSDFDEPIRIYISDDLLFNDFHDYEVILPFDKFDCDKKDFITIVKSFCNTVYKQKFDTFIIRKYLEPIFIANEFYCNYKTNYTIPRNHNLYVKNVRITNYNLDIPFILKDLNIWNPEINIFSNECFPDVTREKLDKRTSQKLAFAIGRAYHLYILEKGNLTPIVKSFLEKFIINFYGDISDNEFCR